MQNPRHCSTLSTRHTLTRQLRVALLTACLAVPVWALDSTLRLEDFHHDTWSTKEGAPGGILGMAQTQDGWLWLATDHGLFRFDGVRFEPFQPYPGEQLLGRRIGTLYASPDGDLWIGYISGGVSQLHQGRLSHHPTGSTPLGMVYEITVDVDGTPWVATNNGLYRYQQKQWQAVGEAMGLPGQRTENIFLDHSGRLWSSNGKHIYRFDRTRQRFEATQYRLGNGSFDEAPDGSVWATDADTVQRLSGVATQGAYTRPALINQSTSRYGLFDREGSYWTVYCPRGVCRLAAAELQHKAVLHPATEATDRITDSWKLSSLNTVSMLEDREGNIWVGTWSGLERFRHNKLVKVKGLDADMFNMLVGHPDGKLWLYSNTTHAGGSLWRLDQGSPPVPVRADSNRVPGRSLDGATLFAGEDYIERSHQGQTERIAFPSDVVSSNRSPSVKHGVATMVDDGRSLWAIFYIKGLYRYRDGVWQSAQALGLPNKAIYIALEKPGVLWVGYRESTVYRVEGDTVRQFGIQDGLGTGSATYIHPGRELLVSGDAGTVLLRGGRFVPLRTQDPEVLVNVSGHAVMPNGDHWLNGAAGLARIKAADWAATLQDAARPLPYELLTTLDGYPGTAQNLLRTPSALLHTDGRLWIAGTGGIAWLFPDRIQRNPLKPPVLVQGLETEQRFYRVDQAIALPAGQDKLRIDYTALSYTMPERVRFRYRLEGLDHGWQEAGTRRSAYYTNLSPGSYTFRVQAANEDGVWNLEGAELKFELQPTFLQSRLFLALCLMLFLALAALLYRWRIQQLNTKARIQLAERERIARALHDTLLQGMQAVTLRFQNVANQLPLNEAHRDKLDRALDQADEMMAAGRDQVMDLRLSHDLKGDLGTALNEAGLCMAADHPASFAMRQEGEPQPLWRSVSDEAYSIGREALSNAFRHADAGTIQLCLSYGREQLTLVVSDDGKGVPAEVLHEKRRPGHWGMTGMRERAERIGGRFSLGNAPTGGTEVVLVIPARFAYQRSAPERCWQRTWRRLWQGRK
ncbi:sensor histidine kinase [Chitinimonas sp.]|uniref:sensor histidine kinase n=1 Tax=Chitinimonas sp. TaxID=1934313 RepID=UPI002F95367A